LLKTSKYLLLYLTIDRNKNIGHGRSVFNFVAPRFKEIAFSFLLYSGERSRPWIKRCGF
jgi:hypothetical protein